MGLCSGGDHDRVRIAENRVDSLMIVTIVKVAIVAVPQNRCKVFVKSNGKCPVSVAQTEFSLHGQSHSRWEQKTDFNARRAGTMEFKTSGSIPVCEEEEAKLASCKVFLAGTDPVRFASSSTRDLNDGRFV